MEAFEGASLRPVPHNRIACLLPSRFEGGGGTLVTVHPEGGEQLELFSTRDSSAVISNLVWSPSGHFLAFSLSPAPGLEASGETRLVVVCTLDGTVVLDETRGRDSGLHGDTPHA